MAAAVKDVKTAVSDAAVIDSYIQKRTAADDEAHRSNVLADLRDENNTLRQRVSEFHGLLDQTMRILLFAIFCLLISLALMVYHAHIAPTQTGQVLDTEAPIVKSEL